MKWIRKNWHLVLLLIFVVTYAVIFSYFSTLRHQAFASNYDLANMDQTVWNTQHGRLFVLSGVDSTVSRFSIHGDLILVLLSPLYLLWSDVRMLLILQSIALALGAVPVYFLSFKLLEKKVISLILALLYLLSPLLHWTNIYDFHGVSLAIPFLLSAFYFLYVKKWHYYWLFVVLSLTTKEEISLTVVFLGLVLFFYFGERKRGVATLLIGAIWFYLMMLKIIPYFSEEGRHWALDRYFSYYKSTNGKTDAILRNVLDGRTWSYFSLLLKSYAFLPVLALPWVFLTVPDFVINILSDNPAMKTIVYHYSAGIIPGLVIASIFGVKRCLWLLRRFKVPERVLVYGLSALILIIALKVSYNYGPLPISPACWCYIYQVSDEDREFEQVLRQIPADVSVTSSREIRPHLTHRENSFTFPNATVSAKFIALIDQNREYGNYNSKVEEMVLMEDPGFLENHILTYHKGHFYLFKKKGTAQ